LGAGTARDLLLRVHHRQRRTIAAVRGHGIKGVRNRKQARAQGNLLTPEAVGITGSVPVLVMMADQFGFVLQEAHAPHNPFPNHRMYPQTSEFVCRKASRFQQDLVRHGNLADIVQQPRIGKPGNVMGGIIH